MDCAECERLTIEYESLETVYTFATRELSFNGERLHVEEYQRLHRIVKETRLHAESVRIALERHRRIHKWTGQRIVSTSR